MNEWVIAVIIFIAFIGIKYRFAKDIAKEAEYDSKRYKKDDGE